MVSAACIHLFNSGWLRNVSSHVFGPGTREPPQYVRNEDTAHTTTLIIQLFIMYDAQRELGQSEPFSWIISQGLSIYRVDCPLSLDYEDV